MVSQAIGWRLNRLLIERAEALQADPKTVVHAWYAAALGLSWSAERHLLATPAPTGLPDAWKTSELLTYGWKVFEELREAGCEPGDIRDAGDRCEDEILSRLIGAKDVKVKVDFSGPPPAGPTSSSPRRG